MIQAADALAPNVFSDAQKLGIFNELERRVRLDMRLEDPEEYREITAEDWEEEELAEPLRAPMYLAWMKAWYYFYMGEYDTYQNEKAMYDHLEEDYLGELCRRYHQGTGGPEGA